MAAEFNLKKMLVLAHDVAVALIGWFAAYWLRFNLDVPPQYADSMWKTMAWVVPLQALFFWRFGLYRSIWQYASLHDLRQIILAVTASGGAVALIYFFFQPSVIIPRSVLILDPILLLLIMGGSRLAYRVWREFQVYGIATGEGEPTLVLGAGTAAVTLLKELAQTSEWQVVGLLDDDVSKHGRYLHGTKVLGTLAELPAIAEQKDVRRAIIAMPSADHGHRRRAVDLCTKAGLSVMTVPSFEDLMSGMVTVSQIRKVEVDDLLGRDPVELDNAGLHGFLTGRVAMVTGAGGSIGSELCRQIARFQPSLLVFFELNEFVLYKLEQEFKEHFPDSPVVCAIGDVKNVRRINQVIEQFAPSVIFHAAAYKHVPLMENENAWEAVQNNVLGTYTIARAAISHNVEKFILISTDKAVNPTNVMGASKRMAEMVCQGLQPRGSTRFVMVRFGNVLGSTGSVIPKFHEQIARGGPITVTHPEITRYFMSIPEAAQLVLQAGLMGRGGEIFVLDMGEPIKIVNMAKDMIRLSGFTEEEIKIVFTGLRPGEKLYEELLADGEHTLATPHPLLRIAEARQVDGSWLEDVMTWLGQGYAQEESVVKQALVRWVPEYVSQNQTKSELRGASKEKGATLSVA